MDITTHWCKNEQVNKRETSLYLIKDETFEADILGKYKY